MLKDKKHQDAGKSVGLKVNDSFNRMQPRTSKAIQVGDPLYSRKATRCRAGRMRVALVSMDACPVVRDILAMFLRRPASCPGAHFKGSEAVPVLCQAVWILSPAGKHRRSLFAHVEDDRPAWLAALTLLLRQHFWAC